MDVSGQLYRRLLLSGAVGAVTQTDYGPHSQFLRSGKIPGPCRESSHTSSVVKAVPWSLHRQSYLSRLFQNNFPLRLTLQHRAVAATHLSFRSTFRTRKAASHFKAPDFDCSRAAGRAFRRSATVLCRLS